VRSREGTAARNACTAQAADGRVDNIPSNETAETENFCPGPNSRVALVVGAAVNQLAGKANSPASNPTFSSVRILQPWSDSLFACLPCAPV
jgi:hypothetical protein